MIIDKHSTITRLRSAIRSQEAASRGLRTQINALRVEGPSTGPQRSALHQQKQAIGVVTRALLLALAMVRGRSRQSQEPVSRKGAWGIYVVRAVLDIPIDGRCLTNEELSRCMAVITEIDAWLAGGPSPVVCAEPMAVAA